MRYTHGLYKLPEYRVWDSMIQRTRNPKHKAYPIYGGRGIKVCQRWLDSFANFIEDMGRRPEGLTLDRIDNEKGYYKDNCRWADRQTQQHNRRAYGEFPKGVSRSKLRYKAEIQRGGIRKHLGNFITVEEASAAYQAASRELYD